MKGKAKTRSFATAQEPIKLHATTDDDARSEAQRLAKKEGWSSERPYIIKWHSALDNCTGELEY